MQLKMSLMRVFQLIWGFLGVCSRHTEHRSWTQLLHVWFWLWGLITNRIQMTWGVWKVHTESGGHWCIWVQDHSELYRPASELSKTWSQRWHLKQRKMRGNVLQFLHANQLALQQQEAEFDLQTSVCPQAPARGNIWSLFLRKLKCSQLFLVNPRMCVTRSSSLPADEQSL